MDTGNRADYSCLVDERRAFTDVSIVSWGIEGDRRGRRVGGLMDPPCVSDSRRRTTALRKGWESGKGGPWGIFSSKLNS